MDREMRKYNLVKGDYAVSELVGGMILVSIAVMAFSSIYMFVLPLPIPSPEPHAKLMGYVDDVGNAVIQHMGGESIDAYRIVVINDSGTLINSQIYQEPEDKWKIGECKFPPVESPLIEENDTVRIIVYSMDQENEQQIFDGILKGKTGDVFTTENAMLISSLRTDTIDEDLICFSYTINPTIDASTYIYKWLVNGNSLAEMFLPFDTNNSISTKDYSDNEYNGTIVNAEWTNNGRVGGAYYFSGSSDYITANLPNIFNDISNNDFTICFWIKSDDTSDDWRVVTMASKDNSNFVTIFQYGTEIHIGLVEDGVKRAMRTENITSNTWYHITGVWDASEKSLSVYLNGYNYEEIGNRNFAMGVSDDSFDIGHGSASSRFWYGYIDEFEIYDQVLSTDQIYQIYMSTKDGNSDKRVIVAEETNLGDIWQCIVIPNDNTQDGTSIESNMLNIVSYGGD